MSKTLNPKYVSFAKNTERPGCRKYWQLRNNSQSIDAVLHPDKDITPSLRRINSKDNVVRKYPPFINECYCTNEEEKTQPTLLSRPKSCVFSRYESSMNEKDYLMRRSLTNLDAIDKGCFCHDTEGLHGKVSCEDDKDIRPSLHFTKQREDYEKYRQDQESNLKERIAQYEEREEVLRKLADLYKDDLKESTSDEASEPIQSLRELKDFRCSHYFETHETKIPEGKVHECVHEYKLDDRLVPEPINIDAYGQSICCICNKSVCSGCIVNARDKEKSIRQFSKNYRHGLLPKKINIGCSHSKIVMNLKEDNINKFNEVICQVKPPQYTNTLALRQQRMSTLY